MGQLAEPDEGHMWINLIQRALASTCFSNAWSPIGMLRITKLGLLDLFIAGEMS